MNATSRWLSVIAYYLSEFDMDAVHELGYKTRNEAMKQLSVLMGRDNNYLKLRRDEFDALPDSSSNRLGWKNRPPAPDVVKLAKELKIFSFEELSEIVRALLSIDGTEISQEADDDNTLFLSSHLTEEDIEQRFNLFDPTAKIKVRITESKVRVYNPEIIKQLKNLYGGKCQICGELPLNRTDISEAHHIAYFSKSINNNSDNIVILCPNHHRLIHKFDPEFNDKEKAFIYPDGHREKLKINYHL